MKEQLKKAKAIIEGYDGPAVRVMEVCGTHTPVSYTHLTLPTKA